MSKGKYRKRVFRTKYGLIFYIIAIIFFLMWTFGPILWSFIISITPSSETMTSPANFFPKNPTFSNYSTLLFSAQGEQGSEFITGMINSLGASIGSILVCMPIAVFGAYALTRMKFRGKSVINIALIATLIIPVMATIIPIFKMFIDVNLIGSQFGLIIVYVSSCLPLVVWLMSSYFSTLPKELEEAAFIDGCSSFKTIIKIILPISYPVMLASMLIIFIATWNQFLIPLILSPSINTKPIAVVISEFVTKQSVNYGLMNAGGILAIIPPSIIAVVFRKFLTYGLTVGATK